MHTVWPEILARMYFGRLLKLLHLAEITLAVWQALCLNDIHSKMTIIDYLNCVTRQSMLQ